MRLNINLASRKYEDARSFYLRWGGALAALVVVAVLLFMLSWKNYTENKKGRNEIDARQREIAAVEQERKRNQSVLDRPENQDVRDQLGFWNDVIYQKEFSWTQLFSDLEKIMPGRTYVISVQPSFTKERRLKLDLMIGGEKHDNAVELVRKMEASERFRFPSLKGEQVKTSQGKPSIVQFDIETFYSPATTEPQPHSSSSEGEQ
jgi:hypothetical protein